MRTTAKVNSLEKKSSDFGMKIKNAYSSKNILAIGPHPDDIEIGCFGYLSKLYLEGAKIYLMILTNGNNKGSSEERKNEVYAAAKLIDAEVIFMGFKEGDIKVNIESMSKVEEQIKKINPDIIFIPNGDDTHQDHKNAYALGLGASRKEYNVIIYDTMSSLNFNPNLFIDINREFENKLKGICCHKSQFEDIEAIPEILKSISIFYSYKLKRRGYIEPFYILRWIID